jgi:hypothetical protein
MSALEEPVVTALVCDAAQVVDQKLYILGGGWSYIWPPQEGAPLTMALAVHVSIPWSLANQRLNLDAHLVSEDGERVRQEFGDVGVKGAFEAGRPPGVRQGSPLVVAFAIQFGALTLAEGGYVWEIGVDETRARVPFQVLGGPPGTIRD